MIWQLTNQVHDYIAECGEEEILVYFSAYESQDGVPVNLDDVAVKGKVIFRSLCDEFWGEGESYHSPLLENPTWLEVSYYANCMIHTTGDKHHIFLEGIKSLSPESIGLATVYEFSMGS